MRNFGALTQKMSDLEQKQSDFSIFLIFQFWHKFKRCLQTNKGLNQKLKTTKAKFEQFSNTLKKSRSVFYKMFSNFGK